jgi:hypothetical protein
MLEEAHKATQLLIQQKTELRNNIIMMRLQCDEMALRQKGSPQKTTPFPSPTPPLTPRQSSPIRFDPPVISNPNCGKSSSLIAFTPPKLPSAPLSKATSPIHFTQPKLNPENFEVNRLRDEIAELTAQFSSIKIKMNQTDKIIESAKLTDAEKKALNKIAKKAASEASTLIYALAKPTNLIPETNDAHMSEASHNKAMRRNLSGSSTKRKGQTVSKNKHASVDPGSTMRYIHQRPYV